MLAQIIAAHHSGLYNGIDLYRRLTKPEALDRLSDARSGHIDSAILSAHESQLPKFTLAPCTDAIPGSYAFWIQILFSRLIDADRLDSEAFGTGASSRALRGSFPTLLARSDRSEQGLKPHLRTRAHCHGEVAPAIEASVD